MTGRGDVILNKSILFHIVSIIGSAPLFFVDVLFKLLIFTCFALPRLSLVKLELDIDVYCF